jgi:hypothetical protein
MKVWVSYNGTAHGSTAIAFDPKHMLVQVIVSGNILQFIWFNVHKKDNLWETAGYDRILGLPEWGP